MWHHRKIKVKWACRLTTSNNKCWFLLPSWIHTKNLNLLSQGMRMTTLGHALLSRNFGKSRKNYDLHFPYVFVSFFVSLLLFYTTMLTFEIRILDFPPQGKFHDKCNNFQFLPSQVLDKCHENFVCTIFCILIYFTATYKKYRYTCACSHSIPCNIYANIHVY